MNLHSSRMFKPIPTSLPISLKLSFTKYYDDDNDDETFLICQNANSKTANSQTLVLSVDRLNVCKGALKQTREKVSKV